MAGDETQKQLLTLIHDFTSEKSHSERRIVNQKKQVEELRSELEAANSELEEAKRVKETAEQEIKGYEVQLSITEASVQAIEARNDVTNKEIAKVGSELDAMKSESDLMRDGFISKMLELNVQIRKFHESFSSLSSDNGCAETVSVGTSNTEAGSSSKNGHDAQKATQELETKLKEVMLQIDLEEQQRNSEQLIHDEIQQELISLEKKALLMDSVMKESMELQDLSRQTSELEDKCAALGDEMQKRFLCPGCGKDNSEELTESQMTEMDSQMTDSQMTDSQITCSQID